MPTRNQFDEQTFAAQLLLFWQYKVTKKFSKSSITSVEEASTSQLLWSLCQAQPGSAASSFVRLLSSTARGFLAQNKFVLPPLWSRTARSCVMPPRRIAISKWLPPPGIGSLHHTHMIMWVSLCSQWVLVNAQISAGPTCRRASVSSMVLHFAS